MDKQLPARPDLAHLRGQAKTLLAQLRAGDDAAAAAFIEHLPAARGMTPATLPRSELRLADAQSVVARRSGFASWPGLARHVEQLRALEGDWRIARLEVDGNAVPEAMLATSRILIDGDRFRTESPAGVYEGIFTIDVEATPQHIDIEFVEGPEAGNWSHGIFEARGDELVICLGLVNATRPAAFVTTPGSGHALEHLRRASAARPANVTGGTAPPPPPAPVFEDEAAFDRPASALIERLQGTWRALEIVTDGKRTPEEYLAHGARSMTGTELTIVFGGQTIVHAKVRVDETTTPVSIDYFNLLAKHRGAVSYGILDWSGDDLRILMAPSGVPRPTSFDEPTGTLSRWRQR